jgi:hypothetical protein
VLIIADLISRKWLPEIVSSEESSTPVELSFTDALDREGLLAAARSCSQSRTTARKGEAIRKQRQAGLERARLDRLAWH